jgi:hypothetical protein
MRRPAWLVFGALFVACWTDRTPPAEPLANHTSAAQPSALVGSYACTITESSYRYPAFPCTIREVRDRLVLAKLGGSVRFEGRVRPSASGFSFEGQIYCPWGDCTEQVSATFHRTRAGALVGELGEHAMIVELVPALAAYGGASYGGASYGGASYGGGPRNVP